MNDITTKAVLVKLSIGLPGNTRKDKRLTDEMTARHSLGAKAGRWLKQLSPQEALEPLTKLSGEARTFHYDHSLPWTDEGWRILPTAAHGDYTEKLRQLRHQFEALSESHFIARLPEWTAWAMQAHNGTFNPEDYPPAGALRRKFSFSVDFQPIPSGSDFRVDLNSDDLASMEAQVNARVSDAIAAAQHDLWHRLATPLKAVVERLSQPEATFRDSLIGNLRDIVSLIPKLNLTGETALESFRAVVAKSLASLAPQSLRDSSASRRDAAARAQDILNQMQDYMPRGNV